MADSGTTAVEYFVTHIAPHILEDCLIIVTQPLDSDLELPLGVVVLDNWPHDLGAEEIRMMVADRRTVLLPCTFETRGEQEAAERVVVQMKAIEHIMILVIQLMPWSCEPCRENNRVFLARHKQMLTLGVDDVLSMCTPEQDLELFKEMLGETRMQVKRHMQVVKELLDSEPAMAPAQTLANLREEHHKLLWVSIPSLLMPKLPKLNPALRETPSSVEKYRFVRKIREPPYALVTATDDEDAAYFIRLFEKTNAWTPVEVESIYREFRFLSVLITHPNIVRCLEMLHGPSVIYLVLEHAGSRSLMQALTSLPAQRFVDQSVVLHCFQQIVAGVAFCHGLLLALRNICFENMYLSQQGDDPYHVKLVNFSCATLVQGTATSQRSYGALPCMAPEMASGGLYSSQYVDQWSVGIILLEMAGGLSSLSRTVPYDEAAPPADVAMSIHRLFLEPGSHARALATIASVQSDEIVVRLQQLLVPNPAERAQIRDAMT